MENKYSVVVCELAGFRTTAHPELASPPTCYWRVLGLACARGPGLWFTSGQSLVHNFWGALPDVETERTAGVEGAILRQVVREQGAARISP